ncbi:MAG: RHS repeat-associated core domain-containing protein [Pirellulaceae bacterium]
MQVFHYDAYGNLLNMAATSALTSYLYSGEAFDTRINQQYLRARWYDPSTGRFTSLDPFAGNKTDPQSLHKYLYTHADPINGVDPTGQFSVVSFAVGFAFDVHLRASEAAPKIAQIAFAAMLSSFFIFLYATVVVAIEKTGLINTNGEAERLQEISLFTLLASAELFQFFSALPAPQNRSRTSWNNTALSRTVVKVREDKQLGARDGKGNRAGMRVADNGAAVRYKDPKDGKTKIYVRFSGEEIDPVLGKFGGANRKRPNDC